MDMLGMGVYPGSMPSSQVCPFIVYDRTAGLFLVLQDPCILTSMLVFMLLGTIQPDQHLPASAVPAPNWYGTGLIQAAHAPHEEDHAEWC